MKQLLQDLKSGALLVQDVPAPTVRRGHLLVRTACSLISTGTERSVVEFGRAGYLSKARQQPERVKQALDKLRTDGVLPAVQAVRAKLEQPIPLGYCNVGRVTAVGEGVEGFEVGDRVASASYHAEIVLVAKHLSAKVPEEVTDEQASFTVIGAIALQGIRLLEPTLGESVAVFGLGLVGQVAVQILKAHGARVIGFDTDHSRVEMCRRYGIEAVDLSSGSDPVAVGVTFSGGEGVDGVLVTANTQSNELMHQAAQMSRKRGRVVLIGVAGLSLRREDFYEKELRFQVSCSYGPGRYDPRYEDAGQDYPIGFVRWTEQRNFEAVLDLLADGRLQVDHLVSERVLLAEAARAYDAVTRGQVVGVVLEYPELRSSEESVTPARTVDHLPPRREAGAVVCGVIGAGDFAQSKLLPGLRKAGARLKWVASAGGTSAAVAARRFEVEKSTTDVDAILGDPEVNCVAIATRHDTHAQLVVDALEAGKSVFVEKPLCLRVEELEQIEQTYEKAVTAEVDRPILMVGFNRRFAPMIREVRARLRGHTQPLAMTYTCNAGAVPQEHWVHDPAVGGGRLLGEGCHFIDLLHFLAEAPITSVIALAMGGFEDPATCDTVSVGLTFADGSLGQVNYFANGSRLYQKEWLEVYTGKRVLRMENFRRLRTYGFPRRGYRRGFVQHKGHDAELSAFVAAMEGGRDSPISFESVANVARATLAALESARCGKLVFVA